MTQPSYYISVNRGYIFLGFAIGVFLQLTIIYQLYFFYGADTQQFSLILFGIPLAAALFQGIVILNFARTLSEKEQARTLTLKQFCLSALITALLFYGIYLGVVPGLLRVLKLLDRIPFVYKTGLFEIVALISIYIVIWFVTKRV